MTRGLLRAIGAACLAVALASGAAPAAAAQPSGKIISITSENGQIRVVFQAEDLPSNATVDPESVSVRIGGRELQSEAKPLGQSTEPEARTAVLVIDVSGSMRGPRIDAAKEAAAAFLTTVPADVRVGLVTFGNKAQVAVEPTLVRDAVADQVRQLKARGDTALYDAVITAVDVVGEVGTRNLLLLSDGKDIGSEASLGAAVQALGASGAQLDAVSLGAGGAQRPLQELARAARGHVITTDGTEQLAAAFTKTARNISNQLAVTALIPAGFVRRSGNVTVSARAGEATISATNFLTLAPPEGPPSASASAPRPVQVSRADTLVSERMLPLALGALFVGLAILLAVAFTSFRPDDTRQGRLRRRLSIYTLSGRVPVKQEETTTALGSGLIARSAVELAGKVVQRRDFEQSLAVRLEAAGVPLRPAEWMLIHVGSAVGAGLLLLLVSGGAVIPMVVGVFLGLTLAWFFLDVRAARRTSAFLAQLPDTLQFIAGSLSAGHSLSQSVDAASREGQQPIATELSRALVEARLGVPLEDALDGVADRMKSKDFAWIVMAIRIQREVGGNLAEVLSTVAGTLRERERLRRQVRALSAEGRLSAWILGLLPPVFALYLALVRPAYLAPLVTEPVGWLMISFASLLLVIGVIWMRNAVRVSI